MRSLPLKFEPGSDLRLSLEKLARDEKFSGFVLGVVGNLSRAAFQCPGLPKPTVLEGNLEIITLNGTLSPDGVHLHLSLSDGDCQVWGGHLEQGTLILKGVDVLIGVLESSPSVRSQPVLTQGPIQQRVEIAVMPGCPWSTRAIRILSGLNIQFKLITIDNDGAFNSMKERSGLSTFPQVFIDGALIGGYDQLAEMHALGKLDALR